MAHDKLFTLFTSPSPPNGCKQDYLVTSRATAADIAFVSWNNILNLIIDEEFDFEKEFPNTYKWHTRVSALDGVKQGIEERRRLLKAAEDEKKKALTNSQSI
ncbi:glutathione S- transferase, nitrogen catabolite repression regulator [Steccherinum ochraceum]|uniref:Glutathione S-transferase, nitrogen catabolite repression regulator n=1 Tax=Steccherinum ochraceum TaxID=92696 RepID=A0A4R0RRH6_9APHY|nr:glutathione S- transferase, nitrogen catabolite repression regulator [Steccherinum ochraceum]